MMRRLALQVVCPILFGLSLIISCYSSHITSLLNYVQITITNQLAINKTSLFLLFNAVLLIVARDSGLLHALSSVPGKAAKGSDVQLPSARGDAVEVKAVVAVVETAKVETSVRPRLELAVVEEESCQESEDDDVEAIEEADELNRRCEEFIEKIKRQRLIEAKQLVISNTT